MIGVSRATRAYSRLADCGVTGSRMFPSFRKVDVVSSQSAHGLLSFILLTAAGEREEKNRGKKEKRETVTCHLSNAINTV